MLEGKEIASFLNLKNFEGLITAMSPLSQKPVMSSLTYKFVSYFVIYIIQSFTLSTETLHPEKCSLKRGEAFFVSHSNREFNAGEIYEIV